MKKIKVVVADAIVTDATKNAVITNFVNTNKETTVMNEEVKETNDMVDTLKDMVTSATTDIMHTHFATILSAILNLEPISAYALLVETMNQTAFFQMSHNQKEEGYAMSDNADAIENAVKDAKTTTLLEKIKSFVVMVAKKIVAVLKGIAVFAIEFVVIVATLIGRTVSNTAKEIVAAINQIIQNFRSEIIAEVVAA